MEENVLRELNIYRGVEHDPWDYSAFERFDEEVALVSQKMMLRRCGVEIC